MIHSLLEVSYLIAAVTFIVGLKMMGAPASARRGNITAAVGMTLAIFATIFLYNDAEGASLGNLPLMFGAIALGTVGGWMMAKRVQMTQMPQMVSFFNGMGGACAGLISVVEFQHILAMQTHSAGTYMPPLGMLLVIVAGLVIGTISFTGSIIAFLKLEERINDLVLPARTVINMAMLAVVVVLGWMFVSGSWMTSANLYLIAGVAALYGLLFVLPIGGADMPVVISLLNSFTGMAAAFGGFLYSNNVMLMGGVLVGSAGTILTVVMCNAMNRSLWNVIIGGFGGGATGGGGGTGVQGTVREVKASDVAILLRYAGKVSIVPGYGLAVAQAQHVVHELEQVLEKLGVHVSYAIHPVAGRMPGHMNVLLAESNVDYDKLKEMDDANAEFPTTDVVLVIGANDVVNPAAKTDPQSPIYGMPILDVEQSQNVIVLKRSMKSGNAGIENELFYLSLIT
ncbi:MAG: NAD(P)(+) transhydrogenase (Re/Si-specific) subunit beta, partial [Candidatus Kapabacteria bacterium]|nr:NAD(P)(+) transhydrogenase (Re/Si-specific) subunit beta [Candidatus Kapabacteria bacterium]